MSALRPPGWAYRLLQRHLPPGSEGETILGDLAEEYARKSPALWAKLWYAGVAVQMAVGYRVAPDGPPRASRWESVSVDVAHAARALVREPSYLIVAVLTLTIGIGATTAIFSIIHGSLLQPLPYRDPERLVRLYGWRKESSTESHNSMSAHNFRDLRESATGFEGMSGYMHWWFNLSATDGEAAAEAPPRRVAGLRVEPGFLDLLGTPPQMGRTFAPEDALAGASPVVIIGDELWRGRFGADPAVVGRKVRLDLVDRTVIGVLPASFAYLRNPQVLLPMALESDEFPTRRQRRIDGFGRLAEGVSVAAGVAELQAIFAGLEERYPEANDGWSVTGVLEHEWRVRRGERQLWLFGGAVSLVLLIACVNVASLMLVRSEARQHELGVRVALGAGRARLARLLVAEALIVAALGGALGALLCGWLVDIAVAAYASSIPRADEIAVDATTLAFAIGVSLISGLGVSLLPVAQLGAERPGAVLGARGRTATGSSAPLRKALVVVEVALAVVLVSAAGLLINTVWRLGNVDLGVDRDNVVTFAMGLPAPRYPSPDHMSAFWDAFVDSVGAIPGVEAVGLSSRQPLNGGTNGTMVLADELGAEETAEMLVEIRAVTPGYFPALGVPLVAGRMLTAADRLPGGGVLVNEEFVRRRVADGDAVGEMLHPTWLELGFPIVGVVADTRDHGPTQTPRPTAYWIVGAQPFGINAYLTASVRTRDDPMTMLAPIRERVEALDADIPLVDVYTLEEITQRNVGGARRSALSLLTAFAGVALALGAIGIYGVVSYAVARRRREIGVRLALGATGGAVRGLILRDGVSLAATGVVIGLLAALGTNRLVAGLLYEVTPVDPASLLWVATVLLATALVACWLPARRAARLPLVGALRSD